MAKTQISVPEIDTNRTSTLAVYSKIPDPLEGCEKLGGFIANSGMCSGASPPQARIIALTCLCEGITPIEFNRRYHLIKGNVSMRADRMLAELRGRGGKYKVISRDSERAEIEITIDGQSCKFTITHDEAKQEDFYWGKEKNGKRPVKDNYATPRKRMQMLWSRVVSDGIRTMCPEIVAGTYTPEEVMDFTDATVVDAQFTRETVTDAAEDVAVVGGEAKSSATVSAEPPPPATSEAAPEPPAEVVATEPPPDEMLSKAEPATPPVTMDQLNRIVDLGGQITNSDTGLTYTVSELAQLIDGIYHCSPDRLTVDQANELIGRLEQVAKKPEAA